MGSLREEHKRIARDRILEGLAVEIAEHGLLGLSVPAVAERAGVSQRTVYNYFENKDVLVGSLGEWAETQLRQRGGRIVEADLDQIPQALEINFRLFSELGALSTALARIAATADVDSPAMATTNRLSSRRTDAVRIAIARVRPDLDSDAVEAVTAMFRTVMSFGTWSRLANDFGLSGADAGRVAAWAFSVLLDTLRDGRGPFDSDR
ncbi:MAG: TetR/AcrR family transcriptional regulator [Acidobacteria bacterium]|nr:TetR/AcrR family transcriptional regulator [Acidobacteriota bacterium]